MMTLKQAIERSVSHNEIVHTEYAGTPAELMVALDAEFDGEIDSSNENDGSIGVWGWTEDMAESEMAWRLNVTCSAN